MIRRGVRLAAGMRDQAQQMHRAGVVRINLQDLTIDRLRLGEPPGALVIHSQRDRLGDG